MSTLLANPVRGRLNAAVLRCADWYAHVMFRARKRRLFAALPETLVEIGPGTGANLRYYRPGTTVVAVEPNLRMHAGLASTARRRGVTLRLLASGAEAIPLADGSVDAVVSTLVLCTVPDQRAALGEIVRVLRPGGRLVFLEHVSAGERGVYSVVQRAAVRPWRWFFEGCELRRDTEQAIASAGFSELVVERYQARTIFLPINPQIAGVAVR
jgi:ubiquinone/menaquinone biosynthesis C-methylase UbiE